MKQNSAISEFISHLTLYGFSGVVHDSIAKRILASSDNSIYHRIPDLVVFPKSQEDFTILGKLIQSKVAESIPWTPRGGFTGTNGQSLNSGIIIDTSRFLTKICQENNSIWVESGVILDQLNLFLKEQSLFFAPHVSTSSRATLGGMFGTDAAGKGSLRYGRTHNHIKTVRWLCPDGVIRDLSKSPLSEIQEIAQKSLGRANSSQENSWWRDVHQSILNHIITPFEEIQKVAPKHPRGLSGYNLFEAWCPLKQEFDWVAFLSGSEGTLGIALAFEIKPLQILPKPKLVLIPLKNVDEMLHRIPLILEHKPLAVELIDSNILKASQSIWPNCSGDFHALLQSVEFLFLCEIDVNFEIPWEHLLVENDSDQAAWWKIRALGVELLSKSTSLKKAVAFAEDTVVPPEYFGDYIRELKVLLDSHHLKYSLFGHADVGCVHMRPFLNLQDPSQVELLNQIQAQIFNLVYQYEGTFWGEHGRGLRTQFVPKTFGAQVFPLLKAIKETWDPTYKWNPNKILPSDETFNIEQQLFAGLSATTQERWHGIIQCNGNGACHNQSPTSPMCPSYQISGDKFLSPKGRAFMAREWLKNPTPELEDELKESLDLCLMCDACEHDCPSEVNIPHFINYFESQIKAKNTSKPFVKAIKERVQDFFFRNLEQMLLIPFHFPIFALLISKKNYAAIKQIRKFQSENKKLRKAENTTSENSNLVILDLMTLTFQPELYVKLLEIADYFRFQVQLSQPIISGKLLYKSGQNSLLKSLVNQNFKNFYNTQYDNLICLEPSLIKAMNLTYPQLFSEDSSFPRLNKKVQTLSQFLLEKLGAFQMENPGVFQLDKISDLGEFQPESGVYTILLHCHELGQRKEITSSWQEIFNLFGLKVDVPSTSCCGMAGIWGELPSHIDLSKQIYEQSWAPIVQNNRICLTTGTSCSRQVRKNGDDISHPIDLLHIIIQK